MPRTADRPLPTGRLTAAEVLTFGTVTMLMGVGCLASTVGWSPALWAIATWFVYVCVYTPLKPYTSWNTAVGAISGALPIVIGWTAAAGPLDARLAAMVLAPLRFSTWICTTLWALFRTR